MGCRKTEPQPLLRDDHYLIQALSPHATVVNAELDSVLGLSPSVLILADLSPLTADQQTRLEEWITRGGILIRFAGPCLAQSPDPLLPVVLRKGERHLGGVLSWSSPAKLGPFPDHSPFVGLKLVEDVRVDHQIFTQPSLDLSQKSWAYLEDGTPLITGEKRDQGYLILIHTTAGPDWSNLALSGLFVQMLERLLSFGSGASPPPPTHPLPPLMSLNGFGEIQKSYRVSPSLEVNRTGWNRPPHPSWILRESGIPTRLQSESAYFRTPAVSNPTLEVIQTSFQGLLKSC